MSTYPLARRAGCTGRDLFEKVEQSQPMIVSLVAQRQVGGRAEVELWQRAAQPLKARRNRDGLGGRAGGGSRFPKAPSSASSAGAWRRPPRRARRPLLARADAARGCAADTLATMELAVKGRRATRRPTAVRRPVGLQRRCSHVGRRRPRAAAVAASADARVGSARLERARGRGGSIRHSQQAGPASFAQPRNFARSRPIAVEYATTRPGGTRARASSGSRAASAVSSGASKSGGATRARAVAAARAAGAVVHLGDGQRLQAATALADT